MQLGCIVAIGALYLMWMGGQGLYTSVKNRTPMELACEHYDEVKPNKEWLRLTGCELNLMESSYMEENGKAVELFIPARGPGEEEGGPIYVLVATDDKELLALTNEMMNFETERELMSYFARNRSKLHFKRDVQGLVRYGVDLDDSDRAELAGSMPRWLPISSSSMTAKIPASRSHSGFSAGASCCFWASARLPPAVRMADS